jgi:hypothetical protein
MDRWKRIDFISWFQMGQNEKTVTREKSAQSAKASMMIFPPSGPIRTVSEQGIG